MLELLHKIVQQVNSAPDLKSALRIIVNQVKLAVQVDVCSVYLTDHERAVNTLEATDGLNDNAAGKVAIPLEKGLVGLVCRQAEPLNLDDAPTHPDYIFARETGEQAFHGFLGVPIIQNRTVLGVLVVRQSEPRRFKDAEVSFLFTLAAQLAGAIVTANANGELEALRNQSSATTHYLRGRPGAGGVALGNILVAYPEADLSVVPDRPAEHPDFEEDSLLVAVEAVKEDLGNLKDRLADSLPAEDRALFDALILMLGSDALVNHTIQRIRDGNWAAGALRQTIEEHAKIFDEMDDVVLRERASDVRDLGRRILTYLNQDIARVVQYPERTILVGEDVSAMQLAEIPPQRLAGIVSATGSSSSHVAILARALGVPAVMGVNTLPVGRLDGRDIIIDGYRGRVYISPARSVWKEYSRLQRQEQQLSSELDTLRDTPSETLDKVAVTLNLNTGLVAEMTTLGKEVADGVGLYRTELPFMVRDRFPSETEQMENYRGALQTFHPRPVTLRTLDIGGDKPLSYFPVTESNPFLGWRGIRISLDHPEIFSTQLRAMLRASEGLANLRVMFPMISGVAEVEESLKLLERAYQTLEGEGLSITWPEVGVMIEVPSAVYQTWEIARRVDFISVGTNDLTQYLLAVDRNNAKVGDLYNDLHPALLKALVQVMEGADRCGREVSICGEMAGNPLAIPLLLGMGVRNFSMSSTSLLRVKWVVRSVTSTRCKHLLQAALRCEEVESVQRLMGEELEKLGLGGLLRPGK